MTAGEGRSGAITGTDDADQIGLTAATGFSQDLLHLRADGADGNTAPVGALAQRLAISHGDSKRRFRRCEVKVGSDQTQTLSGGLRRIAN